MKKRNPKYKSGGIILKRYKVIQFVGEGGFGEVYRVEDVSKKNKVLALKCLEPGPGVDIQDFHKKSARFKAEFRALQLLSPNKYIVESYDLHEYKQRGIINLYIAMEFLEGGSLADKLGGEKIIYQNNGVVLGEEEAVQIVQQICQGIKEAHLYSPPQGPIIHRDIKPQNILFDKKKQLKVVDFGIVRFLGEKGLTLTVDRMPFTIFWASPELITDERDKICPATDIWSVGVILYEMVSGKLPFYGTNMIDIGRKIVYEKPLTPSGVSQDVVSMIDKCLQKDIKDRYKNAQDLQIYLEARFGLPSSEPIKILPGKIACSRCGVGNSAESSFCYACGLKLKEKRETCRFCGHSNPIGSHFCSHCGKNLLLRETGDVRIVSGPGLGQVLRITDKNTKYRIGRLTKKITNDLAIDDPTRTVSRTHLAIYRIGDEYWVEDLNSRNGTYVNETYIKNSKIKLDDTAIISIGNTRLLFQILR